MSTDEHAKYTELLRAELGQVFEKIIEERGKPMQVAYLQGASEGLHIAATHLGIVLTTPPPADTVGQSLG
jgi:hypothetical protein